jgi:hypothetical protein
MKNKFLLTLLTAVPLLGSSPIEAALLIHFDFNATPVGNLTEGTVIANAGTSGTNGAAGVPSGTLVIGSDGNRVGGATGLLGNYLTLQPGDDALEGVGSTRISTGSSLSDLGLGGDTDYTMAAWVKFDNATGDNMVFGGSSGDVLHLGARGSSYWSGHWGDDINSNNSPSTDAGNWHHVTWTNTGTTQEIFVDGVSSSTGGDGSAGAFNGNLSETLLIGTSRNGGSFRGSLDDVAVFSTALNQFQIAALHTLAVDPEYGYDAGDVNELVTTHVKGAGSFITLSGTTWEYVELDPVDGRFFIQLGTDGSGLVGSTGPPVRSFTVDHDEIPSGMPIFLSWDVGEDATSLTIDQGIGDVLPITVDGLGQLLLDPGPTGDFTYTILATNAVGSNSAGVMVTVTDQPIIEFFTVDKIVVAPDTAVQLDWAVLNVDSLTLNGGEVTGTNGLIVMPQATTTYSLTATNGQGSKTEEVLVTVVIPGEPAISEISAINNSIFNDEDGESSDWIELSNPSDTTAILNGYFLSDDPGDLQKWRLPEMNLEPGAFLVIFASGKDRAVAGSELHANFGLAAGGEFLALSKISGVTTVIVSQFEPYPKQFEDTTWGLLADGISTGYFSIPTPNAANGTGVVDYVRDTKFAPDRGFYDAPINVVISSNTIGAIVRYTTDGSAPTVNSGTVYSGPIMVSATTTLRAIAYRPGYLPTDVDTHTYVFLDDVLTQSTSPSGFPSAWGGQAADYQMDPDVINSPLYSATIKDDLKAIPSISIVMRTEDMFGGSGIYSNPNGSGSAWERAGSVEMIDPDGSDPDFQVNCAVRIQGGVGRNAGFLKHSFRLLFKRGFGPTKLDYPLFQNATQDSEGATESFDTVVLRSGFNNSWHRGSAGEENQAQFIRDQFVHDSQLAMGDASSHGTFVHLYLNGLYWGIYNVVERPNAPFASAYYGGEKSEWDALNSYPRNVVDGTATAWLDAHGIANAGVSDQAGYDALSDYVDVPNLINYFLLNFYGGNNDWDDHNWYAARRRVPGAGYKFFCWDAERTLEGVGGNDRTGINQDLRPSRLYNQLRANPEFRMLFADQAHRHLFNGGALTPEQTGARYQKLAALIDRAIVGESARWGDSSRALPYTRDAEWVTERDRLFSSYFPQRSDILLGQLRGASLYPNTGAPVFSQHGGHIASTTELGMSNTNGLIYFTTDGSDPRLPGGAVNPVAEVYDGSTITTSLVSAGSVWKYLDDGSDQGTAWRDPAFVDTTWASGAAQLGYGDGGEATVIAFGDAANKHPTYYFRHLFDATNVDDFSSLTVRLVRDDGAIVYVNGIEAFRSNMPLGPVDFQTSAGGSVGGEDESRFYEFSIPLSMLNEGSNTIAVEVHQTSGSSSDVSFDLALLGVLSNSPDPLFLTETGPVRARALDGAEWSALNEATFVVDAGIAGMSNLVISEIHYRPLSPTVAEEEAGFNERSNFEFIELMNIGSTEIDMTNVRFVAGITFDFDEANIGFLLGPGQRVVVVNNLAAFQFRYPGVSPASIAGVFSGNLNNDGEQIVLLTGDDAIIRDLTYNDQAPWPVSADGDGTSLVLIQPMGNPDHADPLSWRASIVLGGNPAASDAAFFVGDPSADLDRDGVSALLEYFLGTSDNEDSRETLPASGIVQLDQGAALEDYFTMTFTHALNADDIRYEVERTHDLSTWETGAGQVELVSQTDHGDGSATTTFRSSDPVPADLRQFLRLRVILR